MSRKRSHLPSDLTPYTGCPADEMLGLDPLAIGWLDKRSLFSAGTAKTQFLNRLAQFCLPSHTVCHTSAKRPCGFNCKIPPTLEIGGQTIELGRAEIRVIGEQDIYAAPDLIYHYITAHQYQPPAEFIDAVLYGPQPDSAEFRALIRALQQSLG